MPTGFDICLLVGKIRWILLTSVDVKSKVFSVGVAQNRYLR